MPVIVSRVAPGTPVSYLILQVNPIFENMKYNKFKYNSIFVSFNKEKTQSFLLICQVSNVGLIS